MVSKDARYLLLLLVSARTEYILLSFGSFSTWVQAFIQPIKCDESLFTWSYLSASVAEMSVDCVTLRISSCECNCIGNYRSEVSPSLVATRNWFYFTPVLRSSTLAVSQSVTPAANQGIIFMFQSGYKWKGSRETFAIRGCGVHFVSPFVPSLAWRKPMTSYYEQWSTEETQGKQGRHEPIHKMQF